MRDASRKRQTGRQKAGIDSERDGKREEMSDGKRERVTQAPISPIINLHTSLPALFSRDQKRR